MISQPQNQTSRRSLKETFLVLSRKKKPDNNDSVTFDSIYFLALTTHPFGSPLRINLCHTFESGRI